MGIDVEVLYRERTDKFIKKYCSLFEGKLSLQELPFWDVNSDYKKTHKEEIKAKLKGMKYKDFLKTLYWRIVSLEIKTRANFKCTKCGSKDSLNTHHDRYDILGEEIQNMHFLQCLCEVCHSKHHNK